jgi:DNA polymerase elongation subunit (family B)
LKMKESYSDWTSQGHVVLADRMSIRDPGNCPQSGDRIPFAYIMIPNLKKDTKQGERIEHPNYIIEKKLALDYEMYMTNQIMKPALQFLDLALPDAKNIFDEFMSVLENIKIGRTDIHMFTKKKKTKHPFVNIEV